MNVKDTLSALFKATGKTKKSVAEAMGWTPCQLSQRIGRETLRADSYIELLDKLGVAVKYVDKETGNEVHFQTQGNGRRVRRMVDRVIYDTAKSDALAGTFLAFESGTVPSGMKMELYRDTDGRYFFAQYSNVDGSKDVIIPTTESDAKAFIKKYGNYTSK